MDNMEIFKELIRREPNFLDRPIEELAPISFVGQAAVSAYRSMISRLDSLPMSEAQKRKTLEDGQEAGEMLLRIEARIGELLPSAQEAQQTTLSGGGKARTRPDNVTVKQAHTARTIAGNPEIVQEIIKEAKDNEDIPTKTAVLNTVRLNKEIERRKKAEAKPQPEIILSIEQADYINTLERIINLLPKRPPKDWNEKTFSRAKGLAQIIIDRLKEFNDGQRRESIAE